MSREVGRATVIDHLQRLVVPFLSREEIATRFTAISDGDRYELVETLNACLFDHPAFFELRERRAPWPSVEPRPARYRIEHQIRVVERALPEGSLLQLTLPAPREVAGVQRVRLVSADPVRLVHHFLPRAGQLYAAPILVEADLATPPLTVVYEVETTGAAYAPELPATRPQASPVVSAWAHARALPREPRDRVAALVDRIEDELQLALTGVLDDPLATVLATLAGDVAGFSRLLCEALCAHGLVARLGAGQELWLNDGGSQLRYPGATGFDHRHVEWLDPASGACGVVDLSYLERWGFAATPENAPVTLRDELEQSGERARSWLRRQLPPTDFVLAGLVGMSRLHCFASGESHALRAPVDVELVVRELGGAR